LPHGLGIAAARHGRGSVFCLHYTVMYWSTGFRMNRPYMSKDELSQGADQKILMDTAMAPSTTEAG
jgi:hypothetical protein